MCIQSPIYPKQLGFFIAHLDCDRNPWLTFCEIQVGRWRFLFHGSWWNNPYITGWNFIPYTWVCMRCYEQVRNIPQLVVICHGIESAKKHQLNKHSLYNPTSQGGVWLMCHFTPRQFSLQVTVDKSFPRRDAPKILCSPVRASEPRKTLKIQQACLFLFCEIQKTHPMGF